jgi:hypothetical protein
MKIYKQVTPVIVILLTTVLFVGVVTIHSKDAAASCPIAGAALKYKGVAYVSWSPDDYASAASQQSLSALRNTGANYVSVLVTQFVSSSTSNTIYPISEQTPTDAAVTDAIHDVHALGRGVLLKPQLLCADGSCGQGDLAPADPAEWFASYATFVDHYARIAQNNGVELFCVGCELNKLDTSNYDTNWRTVISGVRAIYHGPLTYAADWSTYARISFWGALDYAGIDAYFPLSNAQTPSVTSLVDAWSNYDFYGTQHSWTQEIQTWQATVQKPVIFTEIGYRSVDYTAQDPGNYQRTGAYNANGQANCYEAALQVFANKPWFAGMFWWSWSPDPNAGGAGDTDYTPQHKPAQNVLTSHWLGNIG